MLGLAKFPFSFHASSWCQSICSLSAGSWLEAGGWCFVVRLFWSSFLLHFAGCAGGASKACVVSHFLPPWIRESVSSDLTSPLSAPASLALPQLSLACHHLSLALRKAVPQSCPSVNPHYSRSWTLTSTCPYLSGSLDALLLHTMMLFCGLPGHKTRKRQYRKCWRWQIQIIFLICSEKCLAQRTLTSINPATSCCCCSGRWQWVLCMYVCAYVCERTAQWCGRRRRFAAQCRAAAPAQSIGSLSPTPKLGHRQVHFRATGQIDSSAFNFFRLRSGSCSEARGRSYKTVRNRDSRDLAVKC